MARRVVIIGGGAMGQAAAAFLLRGDPDVQVTVIERDPTFSKASSALSASSIRQQFSTPVNIALSQFSFDFLQGLQNARDDAIGLRLCGYLFLASTEEQADRLATRSRAVEAAGGRVRRHDRQSLARAYPWMVAQDIVCGYEGVAGEGWFDGYSLLQAFRTDAREQGAATVMADAASILVEGGRARGVRLADGTRLDADQVLITAGPWSRRIAETAGLELPIHARRRSVFRFDCPEALDTLPVLIDSNGVFVRRDGTGFLTIVSPGSDDDLDDLPLDPDYSLFEDRIWPTLAARVPAFEQLRVKSSWAGYYEYNPIDHNGIVGMTSVEDLYVASGFSGHGLMHCAGVGRGIAERMTTGSYATIDLHPLRPQRFEEDELVVEEAIY